MKIAILSPGSRALPTGGESIFAPGVLTTMTAEVLTKRGHQVDVYAPRESKVNAKIISYDLPVAFEDYEKAKESDPAQSCDLAYQYGLYFISAAIEKSQEYDIIHAHDYKQVMYFSKLSKCPIVYSYHGCAQDDIKTLIQRKRAERFYDNNFFIAASKRQEELSKEFFNFIGVVPHGVDVEKIPFGLESDGEILYSGRLMKRKRPDIALKIGGELAKKVRITGLRHPNPEDVEYFESEVQPFLSSKNVMFDGLVPYPDIYGVFKRGRVLLLPIEWEEPFGMVMIEAMAAGTPVVAFARGSVPEVVKDGVTGFIVNSSEQDIRGDWIIKKTGIEGMTEAVKKIYDMPEGEYRKMRENCRKHVEENFTVEKMVDGYEKVYQKIIKGQQEGI